MTITKSTTAITCLSIPLYLSLAVGGVGLGDEFDVLRVAIFLLVVFSALYLSMSGSHIGLLDLLIFSLLCAFVLPQVLRTTNYSIALSKVDGFIVGGFFVFLIGRNLIARFGLDFLKAWIVVGALMLCATVVYKLLFGFWDRQIRFFINGPIVFGWMMSLMALSSLFLYTRNSKKVYIAFFTLFFLSVVWTASKGPIFALISASFFLLFLSGRVGLLAVILFTAFSAFFSALEFDLLPERLLVFQRLWGGGLVEADYGSVGVRADMFDQSIEIFFSNPIFGVGTGNWVSALGSSFLASQGFIYPHNLLAEILAEYGLSGSVLVAFCLGALFMSSGLLARTFLTFSICALFFTGDMSYWRFLIFFPMAFSRIK